VTELTAARKPAAIKVKAIIENGKGLGDPFTAEFDVPFHSASTYFVAITGINYTMPLITPIEGVIGTNEVIFGVTNGPLTYTPATPTIQGIIWTQSKNGDKWPKKLSLDAAGELTTTSALVLDEVKDKKLYATATVKGAKGGEFSGDDADYTQDFLLRFSTDAGDYYTQVTGTTLGGSDLIIELVNGTGTSAKIDEALVLPEELQSDNNRSSITWAPHPNTSGWPTGLVWNENNGMIEATDLTEYPPNPIRMKATVTNGLGSGGTPDDDAEFFYTFSFKGTFKSVAPIISLTIASPYSMDLKESDHSKTIALNDLITGVNPLPNLLGKDLSDVTNVAEWALKSNQTDYEAGTGITFTSGSNAELALVWSAVDSTDGEDVPVTRVFVVTIPDGKAEGVPYTQEVTITVVTRN